ncbi:class B sortase [Candidatus Saccharibacteria bacterium]|nr:class B sortase [Candidatus Saccharibacteria bacterium]
MKNTRLVLVIRTFIEKAVELTTMAMFLGLLFIGIYAFYDAQNVNDSGRLDDEIVEVASRSGITSESDNFSLDELKKINSEIVGWVKINDTTIDYPLVQAKNNDKYLARDYKGDYATAGTPFVDYRNNKMADPLTVIYGHRMKDGIMFSDITRFAEKWYFDRHQTGTLYTDEGKYKLELLGFAVLNLGETDIYNVNTYKKNSAAAYNTFKRDAMYMVDGADQKAVGAKLVLLSTCDKDARHKRDVLLLRAVK